MGLFSFLSKNKQETAPGEGEFYSRAEEESQVARGRRRRTGKPGKAANSPVDPVLPEKKRARRRLVGAIALVLAMVIGLPMILDSEQKPVSEDIAIQIPSKDKPGAPVPVAVPSTIAPSPSASGAASAGSTASASAASVPVAASLSQQEQVVQMPKPNAAAGVPVAATPVKMPAPSPAAAAASASVKAKSPEPTHEAAEAKPPVKVERAAEKHDDARAEAILEGKDTEGGKSNAEKKGGKFVVQVAALASQEKVTELQGKLTEAGFKSYVQKVPTDSGIRIRVRVGPFGSKDEAESARVKLGKLGFNGKLMPS